MIEARARQEEGLIVRNRIVWVKKSGHPDPVRDRLVNRHEYILHFALNGYYYDLFGYAEVFSPGYPPAARTRETSGKLPRNATWDPILRHFLRK